MEKLLHERLRELETNERCMVKNIVGLDECPSISCRKCELHMLNVIADEIERYYIPRPRFDDGEPVQFGDAIKHQFGGVDVDKAIRFQFNEYGTCEIHGMNEYYVRASKDEPLKRPTPKVYDADGVECKQGQTVWCTLNGQQGEILFLQPDNKGKECFVRWDDCSDLYEKPEQLTHESPVFDAEGVRICEGDTVWHANHQWIVVGIVYHEGKPWVQIDNTDGKASAQERQPFAITHREPDSLEKLRDDIIKNAPNSPALFTIKSWADRLTALIERGA